MLNLQQNLLEWERVLRLFIAIIGLVATYFISSIVLRIMMVSLSGIVIFTALIGICPLRKMINYITSGR